MKKIIGFFLAVIMLMTSAAGLAGCRDKNVPDPVVEAGESVIYDLTTEDMVDPVGVDTEKPLFGWKMKSDVIGQKQTAYQITVSSENGKVWDSGKVQSGDSVDIEYAGEALRLDPLQLGSDRLGQGRQGEQGKRDV